MGRVWVSIPTHTTSWLCGGAGVLAALSRRRSRVQVPSRSQLAGIAALPVHGDRRCPAADRAPAEERWRGADWFDSGPRLTRRAAECAVCDRRDVKRGGARPRATASYSRSSSSAGERRAYNADVGGSNPSGTTSAVLSRWWAQRPVKPSLRTCRFNSGHRDQGPNTSCRTRVVGEGSGTHGVARHADHDGNSR